MKTTSSTVKRKRKAEMPDWTRLLRDVRHGEQETFVVEEILEVDGKRM